ncbi:6950_t:CDS:2 [Entrophospora sp. SA101]|nr:6950_t:CDS:2 [Entrophospora sp. SA101]
MKPITDSNQRTKTHTYPQSHNPTTSSGKNPFFNEHDHHFCRVVADNDDPIDTSKERGEEEKSPAKIVCPSEIIIDPHKFSITEKEYNNNDYDELDIDLETGLEEEFKEDPPSPTSPRDPEREAPVFTEEEDGTSEAASYRFETDSNWQDESNIEFGDDPDYKIWSDDEGIDPV